MQSLIIEGGKRLSGEIRVHGAKNSALPILAASLLADGRTVIHNCPDLTDVRAAVKILTYLGCTVVREGESVAVDPTTVHRCDIPEDLMREMRSSVVFLGPLLSRMGRAVLSTPGGCEIGLRPIDLHLAAMRKFGVEIHEEHGRLDCSCAGGMQGCRIILSFPSVGATENAMLAAACARGQTTIVNAAREPEISDLADFLNGMGACIHGAGEGEICVEGVGCLSHTEHTVIPDRIAAATFLCAAAVTHGSIRLREVIPAHLGPIVPAMEEMGCEVSVRPRELSITAPPRLHAVSTVRTLPYPGFPTDAQAPLMAAACTARGTSVFVENIFESRYKHVSELIRLGAHIKVEGRVAVVEGVPRLSGAPVSSTDLRGGAALVVAGLAATGTTRVANAELIDRGYERLEESLTCLGADVKRVTENEENREQDFGGRAAGAGDAAAPALPGRGAPPPRAADEKAAHAPEIYCLRRDPDAADRGVHRALPDGVL